MSKPWYNIEEGVEIIAELEHKLATANKRLEFYCAADQLMCELREEKAQLRRELAEAKAKERERCVKAVEDEPTEGFCRVRMKNNIINRIKQEAGEVNHVS